MIGLIVRFLAEWWPAFVLIDVGCLFGAFVAPVVVTWLLDRSERE